MIKEITTKQALELLSEIPAHFTPREWREVIANNLLEGSFRIGPDVYEIIDNYGYQIVKRNEVIYIDGIMHESAEYGVIFRLEDEANEALKSIQRHCVTLGLSHNFEIIKIKL